MRILFLTSFRFFQLPGGEITSPGASARYRMLLPGKVLARLGHAISIVTLTDRELADPAAYAAAVQADACVVSKVFDPRVLAILAGLKQRGIRVVVDFCDNHFVHPQLAPLYRSLAGTADELVGNTDSMVEELQRQTGRSARAIIDPVEGRKNDARFSPELPCLKLVWYGFPMGLPQLFTRIEAWLQERLPFPLEVTVISEASQELTERIEAFNRAWLPAAALRFVAWSPQAVWDGIRAADCVLVPSELNETTRTKSPNRLIEAIYGGRYAVASPLPSYREFAGFCALDERPAALTEALADKQAIAEKIGKGQDYIERRYLPIHASLGWDEFMRADGTARGLKLNLGCGDKILPGHVNVDIVASRRGLVPDVLCDLRELKPFADASAEEILSVHVIEHFWRWEVRGVLREWRRVLQPGGRLILECPNLESACREFLEDPRRRVSEGAEGQRTMWVLYGDPQWQDPYMVHRWGYTPESLTALLTECGFVNVRQEPAQFKLREPRDMRIVAQKPTGT